jgi:hypothetical protein
VKGLRELKGTLIGLSTVGVDLKFFEGCSKEKFDRRI